MPIWWCTADSFQPPPLHCPMFARCSGAVKSATKAQACALRQPEPSKRSISSRRCIRWTLTLLSSSTL